MNTNMRIKMQRNEKTKKNQVMVNEGFLLSKQKKNQMTKKGKKRQKKTTIKMNKHDRKNKITQIFLHKKECCKKVREERFGGQQVGGVGGQFRWAPFAPPLSRPPPPFPHPPPTPPPHPPHPPTPQITTKAQPTHPHPAKCHNKVKKPRVDIKKTPFFFPPPPPPFPPFPRPLPRPTPTTPYPPHHTPPHKKHYNKTQPNPR